MQIYQISAVVFDGEYKKTDARYQAFLQRVSAEAKMENYEKAKVVFPQLVESGRIRDALFKLGRRSDHVSSKHFDGASELCHRVKVGAAGFQALDIFYNWENVYEPSLKDNLNGRVAKYWIGGMENRQAVTNRKKIVCTELVRAIEVVKEDPVRIFSLAGGDGQTIIEAIKKSGRNVEVILVDPDKEALRAAKRNAEMAGLGNCFKIKRGLASMAKNLAIGFKPHIFDVVGLLDYLDDKKVVEVVKMANQSLCHNGIFFTCNIIDNKERVFLEDVLLWFMIYREPEELGQLLFSGGFQSNNIRIICEPFNIHAFAICLKT